MLAGGEQTAAARASGHGCIGDIVQAPAGARADSRAGRRRGGAQPEIAPGRQPARDLGAAPGRRANFNGSAMQLDQIPNQRQAKPRASLALAARKFVDHGSLARESDAGPRIGDGQHQLIAAACSLDLDRAAGRGEFDGV